jgi:hypothetical protein
MLGCKSFFGPISQCEELIQQVGVAELGIVERGSDLCEFAAERRRQEKVGVLVAIHRSDVPS